MNFIKIEKLETNRLYLRKLDKNDIKLYYERLSSDKQISKYMLWNAHKSIDETIKYVTQSINRYSDENCYKWAIALKQTNELIGIIELLKFNKEDNSCSFAYMLGKKFWNKGYATEALKCTLDFGFSKLKLDQINSDHFSKNIASGKVMQKVGMTYIGTEKSKYEKNGIKYDAKLYTISKEDFYKLKEESKREK